MCGRKFARFLACCSLSTPPTSYRVWQTCLMLKRCYWKNKLLSNQKIVQIEPKNLSIRTFSNQKETLFLNFLIIAVLLQLMHRFSLQNQLTKEEISHKIYSWTFMTKKSGSQLHYDPHKGRMCIVSPLNWCFMSVMGVWNYCLMGRKVGEMQDRLYLRESPSKWFLDNPSACLSHSQL